MSQCMELVEFSCRLTLETGAPPHALLPLVRRLRRLATTHQRRCCVRCNGCRTCGGSGSVFYARNGVPALRMAPEDVELIPEELRSQWRPCPTCSTDTAEAAIEATCAELTALRDKSGAVDAFDVRSFVPYFQHDPRGATVRLNLPSHAGRDPSMGLAVPTSRRF